MSLNNSLEKLPISILPSTHEAPEYAKAHATGDPEHILAFSHYLVLIKRQWWKIALTVIIVTGITAIAAFRLSPIYESTAVIAIDAKGPSPVVGQSNSGDAGNSGIDQLFNTEIQLVQTDAVLRPIADRFHLIPPIARKLPEGVKVGDAPVSLRGLAVSHPPNSFLIKISYRSKNPREAADVANAVARSYIAHGMEMRARSSAQESEFMERQIAELKENMDDSATALAGYQRQLGIINGQDQQTSVVTARLLQLNGQYTDAENDRIRKEAAYRALLSGSEAAIEASPQAGDLAALAERLHSAQDRFAVVKTIYGSGSHEYTLAEAEVDEVTKQYKKLRAQIAKRIHVEYDEARAREEMLHSALTVAKAASDEVNAHSIEYQHLKDEADANKALYNELYRKVKVESINGSFEESAIRIEDEARPSINPVFPNKTHFIFLGLFSSFSVSILWVVIADMLDDTLHDPDQARRVAGIEVIGVLPQVPALVSDSSRRSWPGVKGSLRRSKSRDTSMMFYDESVRTVLSSMRMTHRNLPLKSILVTSAEPKAGKSTCIAYMAQSFARLGYRTLLIDADLRNPSIQHNFEHLHMEAGLSSVITEDWPIEEVVQKLENFDCFHVITAGPSNSGSLHHVGGIIEEILSHFQQNYDMIFVDAPPMLCFAEPVQIACAVDGVLVVECARRASLQTVAHLVENLHRLRVNLLGMVLNQVPCDATSQYRS